MPTYRPRIAELVRSAAEAARVRLRHRPVLVVGPYAGEFGHEIMDFQPFVRALVPRYDRVHVITYPGREPIYRAPNVTMHAHDMDLRTAGYFFGRRSFADITGYAQRFAQDHNISSYDMFNTSHLYTRWHRRLICRRRHEPFRSLHSPDRTRDIVLHFRQIDKEGPDKSRNYRPDLSADLVSRLKAEGYSVSCIGHPGFSAVPVGCEDCRVTDLDETLCVLQSARLFVGEMSGPLHLAMYSARPVVTWNRVPSFVRLARVKRNPFRVPFYAVTDNSTNPAPDLVFATVKRAFADPAVSALAPVL